MRVTGATYQVFMTKLMLTLAMTARGQLVMAWAFASAFSVSVRRFSFQVQSRRLNCALRYPKLMPSSRKAKKS